MTRAGGFFSSFIRTNARVLYGTEIIIPLVVHVIGVVQRVYCVMCMFMWLVVICSVKLECYGNAMVEIGARVSRE